MHRRGFSDAVIYHIFLDRFYPGDGVSRGRNQQTSLGFFGGTLRGAIQKLDYIQSLGCNAVWLSPLFASPTHHGYDATDYYTVEPRFGTNAEFIELIEKAHQRRYTRYPRLCCQSLVESSPNISGSTTRSK